MPRHKLKHAPLQEVIFELFWKLPLDEGGFPYDPGLERALGKFENKIGGEFPVYKRTIPEGVNLRIYPKPIHQFWKGELKWPVVQLGPGILAVNDTDVNYVWKDNFQATIEKAIKALQASYPSDLQLERIKLQYIDAVEYDPSEETAHRFIAKNMRTELQNQYQVVGKPKNVHIAQTFELEMESALLLNIQNGKHNKTGQPAIIWTTAVEKSGELDFNNLSSWLEYAHQATSDTFVNMLNPEFYANFDR